jgi:2-dehydro-3-deoxyphosphooctonate aldolase (KDO 8-P synthase)
MKFQLANITVGGGELFLIAGPCVIESEEHTLRMARAVAEIARAAGVPAVFKASYDKANRTSLSSFRGPGIREGLRILRRAGKESGLPVLTDVHSAEEAGHAGEVVDALQIPAFLCRQTDILVTAAKSGKPVNIKKGQFVAPGDMRHAVEKILQSGNKRAFVTERGASFGYHNLVVDMRSIAIMQRFAPVVFDATHSVQLPSAGAGDGDGGGAVSGGQPEFIPLLARAAVAAGCDGVFVEVHDNPAAAKSDGANALPLEKLPALLKELLAVRKVLLVPST